MKNDTHDELQQLCPHAAELLMGLKSGSTEGQGVTNLQRLTCIGNGWNLHVVKMFIRHMQPKKVMTHSEVMLAIAEGPPLELELDEEERELQYALVYTREKMKDEDFVEELSTWSEADELKATILLKDFSSKAMAINAEQESILDSGSGRHINRKVRILDPDTSVSLTGFDDSQQWTQGSGFLPLEAHDEFTNEDFNSTQSRLHFSLLGSYTRTDGTSTSTTKAYSVSLLVGHTRSASSSMKTIY